MRGLTVKQQQVLDFIRQSIRERGYPPTLREIGSHFGIGSTNGVNDHLKALESKGYLTREDMKSRSLRPTGLVYEEVPIPASSPTPSSRPMKTSVPPPSTGAGPVSVRPGRGVTIPPSATAGVPANSVEGPDEDPLPPADGGLPLGELVSVKVLGRVAAGQPILAEENVIDTVRIDRGLLNVSASGAREVFGLRVSGDSMIEAGILHGDYLFVRRTSAARRGDIVVALIHDEATVKYYFPERDHIRLQPANGRMAPILVRAADLRATTILGVVCGIYRRL